MYTLGHSNFDSRKLVCLESWYHARLYIRCRIFGILSWNAYKNLSEYSSSRSFDGNQGENDESCFVPPETKSFAPPENCYQCCQNLDSALWAFKMAKRHKLENGLEFYGHWPHSFPDKSVSDILTLQYQVFKRFVSFTNRIFLGNCHQEAFSLWSMSTQYSWSSNCQTQLDFAKSCWLRDFLEEKSINETYEKSGFAFNNSTNSVSVIFTILSMPSSFWCSYKTFRKAF